MSKAEINFSLIIVLLIFASPACSRFGKNSQDSAVTNSNSPIVIGNSSIEAKKRLEENRSDKAASTSGAEKTKPAAGKGNVQGKVLYNEQPVEGIEVRICENFSTILGVKCDGKTLTTKTAADGVYVLADLDPQTYGGVTAKVFKTAYYIYPQEGIMTAQKFTVAADRTIFADDIHLFKDDIKTTNPKAGAKVPAQNLELKWDAYPDAEYYKVSLYPDSGELAPVSGERVDDSLYAVTETLTNGKYRLKVEAYNAGNRKLAENGDDIKFTVTGGAEPSPKP